MVSKIYVGNISSSTTDKDLFDLFSNSGEVISAKVNFGIDNKTARSAYIVMSNDKDVQKAIDKNDRVLLKGNHIKVIKAHPIDQNNDYFSNGGRSRKFHKK